MHGLVSIKFRMGVLLSHEGVNFVCQRNSSFSLTYLNIWPMFFHAFSARHCLQTGSGRSALRIPTISAVRYSVLDHVLEK
jgi:hypothetical protein